jgi:hypothetical protein
MFVSKIPVQGVYTFGQPRVGNKDFAAAVNEKLGSGIYRFVNDRDIVPRVPLFTMGFCHYGNQTFFDSDGKGTDAQFAVETLKGALSLGKGVFNTAVIGQIGGLIADGVKGLFTGDITESLSRARDTDPQGRNREDRRPQHGTALSRQAQDVAPERVSTTDCPSPSNSGSP